MSSTFRPEIYAIDFGTSNSLLAAASRSEVHPPIPLDPLAPDPSVLRSILHFSEESGWSFGAEALAEYVRSGLRGRFIRSIKRFLPIQSFDATRIGTRRTTLEQLISVLLRHMRTLANRYFDADVDKVLLGRPALFSTDSKLDRLAEDRLVAAAQGAGFREVHFCPEPVAAAYDFRTQIDREESALVGDLGGGTSDYTVMRMSPGPHGAAEVLAIGGVSLAGDALDGTIMRRKIARHFGADVTYKLPFGSRVLRMPRPLMERLCSPAELCLLQRRDVVEFLREIKSFSLGPDDRERMDQLLTLVEDALGFQIFEHIERTKCELSMTEAATFAFHYPSIDVEEVVSRAEFESASSVVTRAILDCLDRTVTESGLQYDDIDVVCLTGGTARVPAIIREVEQRFDSKKLRELRSLHSVIQGLAERARVTIRS